MATVLTRGSAQLVVVFFGTRIEFAKTPGGVTCTAGGAAEAPAAMKAVFTAGLGWFAQASPRPDTELGPLFGQGFKFYEAHSQPYCVATHNGQPGMKESVATIQTTMLVAKDWLTAAGV